jgi:hypothetical protein
VKCELEREFKISGHGFFETLALRGSGKKQKNVRIDETGILLSQSRSSVNENLLQFCKTSEISLVVKNVASFGSSYPNVNIFLI